MVAFEANDINPENESRFKLEVIIISKNEGILPVKTP